jgi:septal ring factor EnvC (AmiA/AmiB activator)
MEGPPVGVGIIAKSNSSIVHRENGEPGSMMEYTAGSPKLLSEIRGFMALNAVERVADEVPADHFQELEEKIYRTIEMYKSARQAQASAQNDAQRLREQLEDREQELDALRRETVQLKKEREEIRARIEKMLAQIESIAEAS